MASKAQLKNGEAPESDSDDEQYVFNLSYVKIGGDDNPNVAADNTHDLLIKGKVVDGVTVTEDLLNTPYATELTENFSPTEHYAAYEFSEIDPIRRKINELSTIAVKSFIQDKIAPVSKKIMETDNSLIHTQLTLQNVSTSVKNASECSTKINTKLQTVISSDFLPKINKIPP